MTLFCAVCSRIAFSFTFCQENGTCAWRFLCSATVRSWFLPVTWWHWLWTDTSLWRTQSAATGCSTGRTPWAWSSLSGSFVGRLLFFCTLVLRQVCALCFSCKVKLCWAHHSFALLGVAAKLYQDCIFIFDHLASKGYLTQLRSFVFTALRKINFYRGTWGILAGLGEGYCSCVCGVEAPLVSGWSFTEDWEGIKNNSKMAMACLLKLVGAGPLKAIHRGVAHAQPKGAGSRSERCGPLQWKLCHIYIPIGSLVSLPRILLWNVQIRIYLGLNQNRDIHNDDSGFAPADHVHIVRSPRIQNKTGNFQRFNSYNGAKKHEYCVWRQSCTFQTRNSFQLKVATNQVGSLSGSDLSVNRTGRRKHDLIVMRMAAFLLGYFALSWIPVQVFVYVSLLCKDCYINDYIR